MANELTLVNYFFEEKENSAAILNQAEKVECYSTSAQKNETIKLANVAKEPKIWTYFVIISNIITPLPGILKMLFCLTFARISALNVGYC